MASYLADTDILLRLVDAQSTQHSVATDALFELFKQGDEIYLTPQNFMPPRPVKRGEDRGEGL